MGINRHCLSIAVMSCAAAACVTPPDNSEWARNALLGTTPLGNEYSDFLSARYAGMVNDHEAAASYYLSALARVPDDTSILDRAVVSMLVSGEGRAAADIAGGMDDAALRDAPFALLNLVAVEIGRGKTRRALDRLESADLESMVDLGRVLQIWLLAERNLDKAMGLASQPRPGPAGEEGYAPCLRGLVLAAHGEQERALEEFQNAGVYCRQQPDMAAAQIRTLAASGDRRGAQVTLEALPSDVLSSPDVERVAKELASSEDVAPVRMSLAEGAARSFLVAATAVGAESNPQLGAVFFQMALGIDEDLDRTRILLADAHLQLERAETALAYAREVPGRSGYYTNAQWAQAQALISLEREDEAVSVLRTLAARKPSRELSMRVADAMRVSGLYAEAEQIYDRLLLETGPVASRDWRPYFGRAAARQELDRWSEAEADLIAALQIDPDQPDVLNFLGYAWVNRGENIEAGFDMIRKAIVQRPRAGYIVDSLGWAHYRMGQYQDAILQLERAVELTPGDPVITDHLGDAYWQADRRAEAGFEWRRAIGLNPDPEHLAVLEDKVQNGLQAPRNDALAEADISQTQQ